MDAANTLQFSFVARAPIPGCKPISFRAFSRSDSKASGDFDLFAAHHVAASAIARAALEIMRTGNGEFMNGECLLEAQMR